MQRAGTLQLFARGTQLCSYTNRRMKEAKRNLESTEDAWITSRTYLRHFHGLLGDTCNFQQCMIQATLLRGGIVNRTKYC